MNQLHCPDPIAVSGQRWFNLKFKLDFTVNFVAFKNLGVFMLTIDVLSEKCHLKSVGVFVFTIDVFSEKGHFKRRL